MLLPGLLAAALAAGPAAAPSVKAAAPDLELAGAELGAVRVPSAPDAWGGPRTGKEPTLSDRVADYALRAVLDPVKHTLEGTARLTWRNRSAVPVRSLYFHLYLNAFESESSVFQIEKRRYGGFRGDVELEKGQWGFIELRSVSQAGRAATWKFVHPDGGPETDHTVARVDLPEPVPPGGTTTVDLAFFDQLPRVTARTGWWGSFHLAGQWYPKLGVLELPGERGATRPRWNCHEFHLHSEFYADFGAYQLEIVAPEGFTVAASGARAAPPEAAKDGVVHRFRAEDVHDVAFTAWDGFAPPLTATWTGPGSPEVKVLVLYPPEYERSAREALQATLDALRYYSETLGPYPYSTSTVVLPPFNAEGAAGMEYETFFTTERGVAGMMSLPGMLRYVTVHEFGHGYFMGLVASNEFEEPFLDEGMDEWWSARMQHDDVVEYAGPAPLRWLGFGGARVRIWDFERGVGTTRHPADPAAGNSWNRYSAASYSVIYSRSVVAFQDLATLLGEETAARAMRLYYARWHFRHPGTADLRQAWLDSVPEPAGRAVVERWFEEQVFAASPVDDRVERVESEEVLPALGFGAGFADGGKRPEVSEEARDEEVGKLRQAWKKEHGRPEKEKPGPFPWKSVVTARRYAAHVPRTVVITFEDGTVEKVPWPEGQRWGRWELVRPVRVRQAELDSERPVLLDLSRLDDGRTRERKPGTAARLALGAEGWLRVALALLEAL